MPSPPQQALITFSAEDNVAIALSDLPLGASYPLLVTDGSRLGQIAVADRQPAWYDYRNEAGPALRRFYKIATRAIARNELVIKDRVPIGAAVEAIAPGQVVHQVFRSDGGGFERVGGNIDECPNLFAPPPDKLEVLASAYSIREQGMNHPVELRPREAFPGSETVPAYARPDHAFGSRNHVLVIPTVFCVNQEAAEIAAECSAVTWGERRENRVLALPHTTGCCQIGFDEEMSLRLLGNMIAHPNVGAALIVSLGCSPFCAQDRLLERARQLTAKPIATVNVQHLGRGRALAEGKRLVREMAEELRAVKRVPCPLDELLLAVKCGASDPTSGLFSNTAIGHLADLVLDAHGSVVISEIMEFFGAEKILKPRCRTPEVWLDLLRVIKANEMIGKSVAVAGEKDIHSMELTMGNIVAGLSTQEEKSLGAIRKMGFAHPIENVVGCGQRIAGRRQGLYVMDGPGQDLLSVSALSAGGSQVMLFSTGIGSPLGSALTPVIKVTANRETAERQPDFIDLFVPFAELLGEGLSGPEIARRRLHGEMRAVLGGKLTCAEQNGHRDFAVRAYAMVQ